MQEMQVTSRGFISDLEPSDKIRSFRDEMLKERNSSATSISRAEVMKGIKEEEERKKVVDIADMLTRYDLPAIPKSPNPYTTDKMVAQILAPIEEVEEEDPYVQILASANHHTVDLIHQAVEQLHTMPTLIVVSNLRWMAHQKLLKRLRYHYHGIRIPIVPSDGPCEFDVKVYGAKM